MIIIKLLSSLRVVTLVLCVPVLTVCVYVRCVKVLLGSARLRVGKSLRHPVHIIIKSLWLQQNVKTYFFQQDFQTLLQQNDK